MIRFKRIDLNAPRSQPETDLAIPRANVERRTWDEMIMPEVDLVYQTVIRELNMRIAIPKWVNRLVLSCVGIP